MISGALRTLLACGQLFAAKKRRHFKVALSALFRFLFQFVPARLEEPAPLQRCHTCDRVRSQRSLHDGATASIPFAGSVVAN
jgi:hypothetical protein